MENTQSTHAPEVQASMGSLISQLRARYWPSFIDLNATACQDTPTVTAALSTFLTAGTSTNSTIQQYRNSFDTFINTYPADQQAIIEQQIKNLLTQHPGIPDSTWNDNDERWAINHVYDASSGISSIVAASPAETFLLVLCAIHDSERVPEENQHDLMKNLATQLLTLAQGEQEGHNMCSGGRQHELLFILEAVWLNKMLYNFLLSNLVRKWRWATQAI